MAKPVLDLTKFTFTAEQVRDINELVYEKVLTAPNLDFIHAVHTGIEYDKEIGFVIGGGLVGKAKQGCDPVPHDFAINTRKVTWKPKEWEIIIDECATNLNNTAALYCKKNGVAMDNLEDTDYMAIVVMVLTDAIKNMIYRIVWFSDTDAANVGDGDGIITEGVDVEYFNLIDGFFKQLQTASTQGAPFVEIAANNGASKKDQKITPQQAHDLLEEMYDKAPLEMRAADFDGDEVTMTFKVTQSVADAYRKYLSSVEHHEVTYNNLVEGVKSLEYNGVPVIPMPIWDKMIKAYNDLGNTYYKPHRAVLCETGNLAVGIVDEGEFSDLDVFYDKMSRKNRLEGKGKIDAELINFERLVYAQ